MTLLDHTRQQYALDWQGIHGAPHWAGVRENCLRLAAKTGANAAVVELFAFLHDSMRLNEGDDPMRDQRAADFARTLYGSAIELSPVEFDLLLHACEGHAHQSTDDDITVATCWDTDRLDLGHVRRRTQSSVS